MAHFVQQGVQAFGRGGRFMAHLRQCERLSGPAAEDIGVFDMLLGANREAAETARPLRMHARAVEGFQGIQRVVIVRERCHGIARLCGVIKPRRATAAGRGSIIHAMRQLKVYQAHPALVHHHVTGRDIAHGIAAGMHAVHQCAQLPEHVIW
jgi:hypothetical protein